MKDLMQSAYYANKIPMYEDDLRAGTRKMVQYLTAKKHIAELCKKYNVKAIIAHNARFDYRATNTTQRYLTCSKYRYFLPYGLPIYDTLKMVKSTVAMQKSYLRWCEENGFMVSANRPRMTAEILYKYMTGNIEYAECHTGLEDVLIEKEIFVWCMRQHKKMDKKLWA
jgi:DNA polymerase III epsilon subunit-like protein